MSVDLPHIKTGICVFDLHHPYHNKTLWGNILEVSKLLKPDYFIFGGDNMDMDAVNHWEIDKGNKRGMEGKRLRRSYDSFQTEILDNIEAELPSHCRKIFMYGNHECLNKKTDVLTDSGWKNITKITNEKIAQFDINTNEITFDYPIEKIKKHSKYLIRIEGNKTRQEVTPNHDVVVNHEKVKAKDLLDWELEERQFTLTGHQNGLYSGFSEEDIRLLTWVVMDGTIVNNAKYVPRSTKIRIQFKLSYRHKIKRLKSLLRKQGIGFTYKKATKSGGNKLQPYLIRIYGDEARRIYKLLNGVKVLPSEFRNFNSRELSVFLEELLNTDGGMSFGRICWTSIEKKNIDAIYEACIKNNIVCRYRTSNAKKSGFKNGKKQYSMLINQGRYTLSKIKVKKIKYNDLAYCFTMPKGTLITRLRGRVAFTGNCWIEKYIDKCPELEGFAEIERNLNLKSWEVIPYRQTVKIGKMYFHHGEYTGKYHSGKMSDVFERNIIYGHLHSFQAFTKVTPVDGNAHMAMSMPCACDLNPQYMRDKPSAWVNGFGVFYLQDNGNFNIYPVIALKGHFIFSGKYY